jgi:hypothetical protein
MTELKNCTTCKYEDIGEDDLPCKDCYDSFFGHPFQTPSKWEKCEEVSHENIDKMER